MVNFIKRPGFIKTLAYYLLLVTTSAGTIGGITYSLYERDEALEMRTELSEAQTFLEEASRTKEEASKVNFQNQELANKQKELAEENSNLAKKVSDYDQINKQLIESNRQNSVYEKELKKVRDEALLNIASYKADIRHLEEQNFILSNPENPENELNIARLRIKKLEGELKRNSLKNEIDYNGLQARYNKSEFQNQVYSNYIRGRSEYKSFGNGKYIWVLDDPFYTLITQPRDEAKRKVEEEMKQRQSAR